ncbi:MAG: DNA polymerase III subunit beta [Candidatus Cloacimonetes bacterium]|nr:DNA polymerase III subunit beta [Candidatus Cloacimonadota bacterium]
MVFSVNKKDIADKLQHLMNVIPSKSNMMVLSNFRIDSDTETNEITITATDLNITTFLKITANVVENGSLLVSARHLADIINSLPDLMINFSLQEDNLIIECGKSKFKIGFIEASLFPEISFIENEMEYTLDAQYFKKLISNTTFCAATEAYQSICTGVYFKIESNLLTMAGTDTKRIGEAKLKTKFEINEPYEIVLPPRALNFIEKNITQDVSDITIKFDERRISFYLKNILLLSNKYEGKFPTYTVAFKYLPDFTLMLSKSALRDALRRVSLLSEDEDKLITISMNNEEIKVETFISDRGNAKEVISDFTYDGPEAVYCLNSRLLSSLVNAVESDDVIIKMRSNVEPIWILNNQTWEELEIRFVVMPMRMDRY